MNGSRDGEPRKQNAGNVDILLKAKEMGMKIWQLEKLQRVMSTMFDGATESQSQQGRTSRSVANLGGVDEKHVDLSRMLRNERVNGPSDRDAMAALSETIPFKGPYIYIRDMDEKTKPVMVREYRRVARNETGDWPQFWSVSAGKCPFVEEVEKVREEDVKTAPRTRAMTALEKAKSHPPEVGFAAKQKQPLGEPRYGANSAVSLSEKNKNQSFCAPPPSVPTRGRSPTKGSKSISTTVGPRLFGGEPAASGMQPSNITSAIRSQMISSTAAAPGAKAGTSKEFQGLKRKVLERNNGPALNAVQTSQRTGNLSRPARAERSIIETRQTRGKAQEKLVNINEDAMLSEEDALRVDETKRADKPLSKSTKAKDLKPGYCENCRDKYDDFDEVCI